MQTRFDIAAGSVSGREHLRAGRNNQDAFCWSIAPHGVVAVVCDGCSSGRHSELGALLGARLLLQSLCRHLSLLGQDAGVLEWVRQDVLAKLKLVASSLGGVPAQAISDYLLFTIVAAVIGRNTGWVFSLGDGVAFVNGERLSLARAEDNRPAYLAQALLEGPESSESFRLLSLIATPQLESLLIGSDGVEDLEAIADRPIPGMSELVGPVSTLWQDDRLFRNQDALRRRLSLVNRSSMRRDPATAQACRQPGLLPDDTTVVVIRRRQEDSPCSS